jgi:hypothetical protein
VLLTQACYWSRNEAPYLSCRCRLSFQTLHSFSALPRPCRGLNTALHPRNKITISLSNILSLSTSSIHLSIPHLCAHHGLLNAQPLGAILTRPRKDTLEEAIQTAITRGMQTFALTKHMPRDSDDDMYPEEVRLPSSLLLFLTPN